MTGRSEVAKKPPKPGMLMRKSGVSKDTIEKVAQRMHAAENAQTQEYEYRYIPIANIRLWGDQPRTMSLEMDDVIRGYVLADDPLLDVKNDELEGIIGLAISIRESGMNNAPLTYALPGKDVQLMGGQRRTMALTYGLFHLKNLAEEVGDGYQICIDETPDTSLLETEKMRVKVFLRRPDEFALHKISMTDNTQRLDLSLADKIQWVYRFAQLKESRGKKITWKDLADHLGINRAQAYSWLKIALARNDKWVSLVSDMVAKSKQPLTRLIDIANAPESEREELYAQWFNAPKGEAKKISLGSTTNGNAIKALVLRNIPTNEQEKFAEVDWSQASQVKKAFVQFLEIWEKTHD